MSKRIEFQVSDELFGRVESARGDVSRSRWVTRAVERYADHCAGVGLVAASMALRAQASDPVVDSPEGPKPLSRVRPSVRDTWAR